MDNVKPEHRDLPAWLQYLILRDLMSRLAERNLEPGDIPYGWQALQTLEERLTQHAQAITQDFTAALHALEAARARGTDSPRGDRRPEEPA